MLFLIQTREIHLTLVRQEKNKCRKKNKTYLLVNKYEKLFMIYIMKITHKLWIGVYFAFLTIGCVFSERKESSLIGNYLGSYQYVYGDGYRGEMKLYWSFMGSIFKIVEVGNANLDGVSSAESNTVVNQYEGNFSKNADTIKFMIEKTMSKYYDGHHVINPDTIIFEDTLHIAIVSKIKTTAILENKILFEKEVEGKKYKIELLKDNIK